MRDAGKTRAKFLLTSRRDETKWLGDLPRRITVPPMPMRERVQLAQALAERAGHKLDEVQDWFPLLTYAGGNPLTITVLVRQVLKANITTKNAIENFVDKLRAGEAGIDDDEAEGRSKSLGASLAYGFEAAFSEDERKQLAVLHLFQGFVASISLMMMGDKDQDWRLESLRGITNESAITLLDKAAEIGVVRRIGDGFYTIHPALPWYLRREFEHFYPTDDDRQRATRAYVETIGSLGNEYTRMFEGGQRGVLSLLAEEEANLLHARRLARSHEWWGSVINTMQGLSQLYTNTGRGGEWRGLVDEIAPDFAVPETELPLPGREVEDWSILVQYRVRLAQQDRDWETALRLQTVRTEVNRKQAAPYLDQPDAALDAAGRNRLRSLATSLHELGQIQREQGLAACVQSYEESAAILQRIGDRAGEAVTTSNLGTAYKDVADVRNLDAAEKWYRRSLELTPDGDHWGRGRCMNQLGLVMYERFQAARAAEKSDDALRWLSEAERLYLEALRLFPASAVDDLAVAHNQLGVIYRNAGQMERALSHYDQAIGYAEQSGNLYQAGQMRYNVALVLTDQGRFRDALLYAQAALKNFQAYGDRTLAEQQKTQQLMAQIQAEMDKGPA